MTEAKPSLEVASPARSLTARATLGGIATAIKYVVQLVISLLITPIIVHGLGKHMYGVWMMIQQTLGYIALADLRATGTVKLTLAADQHNEDVRYKRQQVGATLMVLGHIAPLVIAMGLLVIWGAPSIFHTAPESVPQIRWALAVGMVGILLGELSSISGNILRGVNLEYKGMGWSALSAVASSSLAVVAIWIDAGLAGLAIAGVVGQLVMGMVRYLVARAHVPWFGYEWPDRTALRRFWRQTIWIFMTTLGFLLQNATDILLVGYLFGPAAAAVYGTTGAVLRMGSGIFFSLAAAVNPGIAGLCGLKEWNHVKNARNEIHLLVLVPLFVFCTGVLILNGAFVSLWLGPTYYAGDELNLLLVVGTLLNMPVRVDAGVVDGMLRFKERAISAIITSVAGLAIGVGLSRLYGFQGIAAGVILGNTFGILAYAWIIRRVSGIRVCQYLSWIIRPSFTGFILCASGYILAKVGRLTLLEFLSASGIVTIISVLIMAFCGLGRQHRAVFTKQFANFFRLIMTYSNAYGSR